MKKYVVAVSFFAIISAGLFLTAWTPVDLRGVNNYAVTSTDGYVPAETIHHQMSVTVVTNLNDFLLNGATVTFSSNIQQASYRIDIGNGVSPWATPDPGCVLQVFERGPEGVFGYPQRGFMVNNINNGAKWYTSNSDNDLGVCLVPDLRMGDGSSFNTALNGRIFNIYPGGASSILPTFTPTAVPVTVISDGIN